MKQLMPLVCAALLVWTSSVSARENDTHESLTKELIQSIKGISDILATVKDKPTADEARPKLRAAVKTMADLKLRSEKLGKPTKEQEEELKKKYSKMLEEQVKRLTDQAVRLQNVEGGKELLKELEVLGKGPN